MTAEYDAITIGSGLGGLTAAALYARAGHRVLVLEPNDEFGGAATTYRHGPLTIEGSPHQTARQISATILIRPDASHAVTVLENFTTETL